MVKLSPSILAADMAKLGEEISVASAAGADYIHIDIMDGRYVPSISFGPSVVRALRSATDCFFDVHLMIEEPDRYLEELREYGTDGVTVHAESCVHLHRTVQHIKELGMKAGVALNPATPLTALDYILEDLDMVLIMTVDPGFGGQTLIPSSYEKIRSLRTILEERKSSADIEVDGGITFSNISDVIGAGATVIVAGTAVFQGDIRENVNLLKEAFGKCSWKT